MVRLLAIASLLFSSATVFADIPLPKGERSVKPVVRFEGLEKHADHVFFLRYLSSVSPPIDGIPPMVFEVKDSKPIDLGGGRFILVYEFFALTKDDFARRLKDDPSRKWLKADTPGVLRADINGPITIAKERDKADPVTSYRVSIKNGKLFANLVKDNQRSEAPVDAPFGLCAMGSALTLSIASLGIWFARRRNAVI